jgi:hypothetical protein
MSKLRESEKLIPKFHRRKFEDISLFFYVRGQRDIMPVISVEKAIFNYFKSIGESEFNIESMISTFTKLQAEFNEL